MAADTILGGLAQSVGTTEPALRLLLSILIGEIHIILLIIDLRNSSETKNVKKCLVNYDLQKIVMSVSKQ